MQPSMIADSVQSLLEKMPDSCSKQNDSSKLEGQKQAQSFDFYSISQPKRHNPDLPARLYGYQSAVDQKLEKLVDEQESRVMEECTFRPSTNTHRSSRSFSEFLSEQLQYESKKQEKLEELRGEKEKCSVDSSFFRPNLCEKSLKLLSQRRDDESVFIQLYRRGNTSIGSPSLDDSDCTFTPQVNSRPRKFEREGSISEHLYSDALRRQNRPQATEHLNTSKMVNKESEKFVVTKLTADFSQAFDSLSEDDNLGYSMFVVLLQQLNFIKNDPNTGSFTDERFLVVQAWDSLSQEGVVSKGQLLGFLMGVMNYSSRKKALHSTYGLFFHNKVTARTPGKAPEYSFKPILSVQTERLAAQKREERADCLLYTSDAADE